MSHSNLNLDLVVMAQNNFIGAEKRFLLAIKNAQVVINRYRKVRNG